MIIVHYYRKCLLIKLMANSDNCDGGTGLNIHVYGISPINILHGNCKYVAPSIKWLKTCSLKLKYIE